MYNTYVKMDRAGRTLVTVCADGAVIDDGKSERF
jgi:hypothetical protein